MNLEIDYLWSHKCPKKWNQYTLVALVITIIILLILAGITIASLTSTGLFSKTQEAKTKTEEKQLEENTTLNEYANEITKWTGNGGSGTQTGESQGEGSVQGTLLEANKKYESKAELVDVNGNKIVVPAGFKIVSDATTNNAITVDQGIVIEDETGTATNGSQFVWIPAPNDGKVYTNAERTQYKEVKLNRYTFAEDGTPTAQNESNIPNSTQNFNDLEKSTSGNSTGNITAFKTSVATNGGFYIGRYEARKNSSEKLTSVKTDAVFNNVNQPDAATYSKKMYSAGIKSELINSYAWDTTIVFLQMFGGNDKYSSQNSSNTGSIATTGTDIDKLCNVYDMASNLMEWTTETCVSSSYTCTYRGGTYYGPIYFVAYRDNNNSGYIDNSVGFRPILYF